MRGLYTVAVTLIMFQAIGVVSFAAGTDGSVESRETLGDIGDDISQPFMENATSPTERVIGKALVKPMAYSSEWVAVNAFDIGYQMQWIPAKVVTWLSFPVILSEMLVLALLTIDRVSK